MKVRQWLARIPLLGNCKQLWCRKIGLRTVANAACRWAIAGFGADRPNLPAFGNSDARWAWPELLRGRAGLGCGVPALEGTGKSHPSCQSSCYNVAMRSTSIRELHIHTSELVREAEAGNVIVIERRGEPVAQLQALSQRPAMPEATVSRVFRELRELRAETPAGSGVDQALTDDRARY